MSRNLKTKTREQWLQEMAAKLRSYKFGPVKIKVPDVQISAGFPLGKRVVKAEGESGAVGQCFNIKAARDKKHHIFVSPVVDDAVKVVAILAHEMLHAAMFEEGHNGVFLKAAQSIGLEGKATATTAGEAFKRSVKQWIQELGPYPHGGLSAGEASHKPKQGTRLIKVECPKCGYIVRTTQKWLELGNPYCNLKHEMIPEDMDAGDEDE